MFLLNLYFTSHKNNNAARNDISGFQGINLRRFLLSLPVFHCYFSLSVKTSTESRYLNSKLSDSCLYFFQASTRTNSFSKTSTSSKWHWYVRNESQSACHNLIRMWCGTRRINYFIQLLLMLSLSKLMLLLAWLVLFLYILIQVRFLLSLAKEPHLLLLQGTWLIYNYKKINAFCTRRQI